MAKSLPRLLTDIRNCTLCAEHLVDGVRPVLQVSGSARLLVAGQAPGWRVHESGVPFDDPSGERLRAWTGLDRETFYDAARVAIVPMGFCFPGSGRSGDLPPRPECAATWRRELLAHLPHLALTLLVGRHAVAWHLGRSAKASLSETVRAFDEYAALGFPLPHPSPRNNLWLRKHPWFETDVLPVLRARVDAALGRPPDDRARRTV